MQTIIHLLLLFWTCQYFSFISHPQAMCTIISDNLTQRIYHSIDFSISVRSIKVSYPNLLYQYSNIQWRTSRHDLCLINDRGLPHVIIILISIFYHTLYLLMITLTWHLLRKYKYKSTSVLPVVVGLQTNHKMFMYWHYNSETRCTIGPGHKIAWYVKAVVETDWL